MAEHQLVSTVSRVHGIFCWWVSSLAGVFPFAILGCKIRLHSIRCWKLSKLSRVSRCRKLHIGTKLRMTAADRHPWRFLRYTYRMLQIAREFGKGLVSSWWSVHWFWYAPCLHFNFCRHGKSQEFNTFESIAFWELAWWAWLRNDSNSPFLLFWMLPVYGYILPSQLYLVHLNQLITSFRSPQLSMLSTLLMQGWQWRMWMILPCA